MKTYIDYLNEKLFTMLIIFAMFAIPIMQLLGILLGIGYFFQEEIVSIIGFLNIFIIIFYLIKKILKREKINKVVFSDIFILISFVFCIISLIFANDFYKSFFGEYGYSETIFNVCGYFSLFFLSTLVKEEGNKEKIFNSFMILCVFETIIAFLQNFKFWPMESWYDSKSHNIGHFAFGLTQHCNFFAALSIIFTGIAAGAYMYKEKNKKLYLIVSILACLGTLFTYTRIAWVGIFSILVAIIIIEIFITKKRNNSEYLSNKKRFFTLAILFIICFFSTGIISGQLERDFFNTTNELSDFDSIGTNRGRIWKVGLYALKIEPLTGVGFDDYRHAYDIYPEKYEKTQNKGHNEYIHTMVTQGILSGINYIILSLYCCIFPLRKMQVENTNFSKSNLTKILFIALFSYMVQALFNSSINNVAPYKWILMGLLLPRSEQRKNQNH